MKKQKTKLLILKTILAVAGLGLIGYFSHWAVALGVFLFQWEHNLDRHN